MSDLPATKKRRIPGALLVAAIALTVLAVVLTFIARGWHPEHWRPVAAFLLVAAGGATFEVVGHRLARRRAQRFRNGVPRGVPLEKPRWMLGFSWVAWFGAAVGAVAAAIGFPAVGLGMALTLASGSVIGELFLPVMYPSRLTFETTGLRLGARGTSFLVPWREITDVQLLGATSVWLHLVSVESALVSVEPDTPEARKKVKGIVLSKGNEAWVMLGGLGLDARTLMKAIEEAKTGELQQPN